MTLYGGILFILILSTITESAKWSYEGHTGPDHWGNLFPIACAGKHQSPIDIDTENTVYNPSLKDLVIFFDPPSPESRFYVQNNGHTIQVNTEGQFYVSNGGLDNIYNTAQFHFHWGHKKHHVGSEHTIDGKASPMEMHIVSWNSGKYNSFGEAAVAPNGLAVLGILFEITKQENPAFEPIVNVITKLRDPDMNIKVEIPAVSMRAFLPPAPNYYYRYNGSLTTPGCFESVTWTVFHFKQTISRRQLQVFRKVLKSNHHRQKRSFTRHNGVQDVLEEIDIADNAVEKARLRRTLQDQMVVDSNSTNVIVVTINETLPVSEHDESTETHQDIPSSEEEVHNNLINNYRPVQPLNGRILYRSFPFLEEPVSEETMVVDLKNQDLLKSRNNVPSVATMFSNVLLYSSLAILAIFMMHV